MSLIPYPDLLLHLYPLVVPKRAAYLFCRPTINKQFQCILSEQPAFYLPPPFLALSSPFLPSFHNPTRALAFYVEIRVQSLPEYFSQAISTSSCHRYTIVAPHLHSQPLSSYPSCLPSFLPSFLPSHPAFYFRIFRCNHNKL
jgi:hypothetical protein